MSGGSSARPVPPEAPAARRPLSRLAGGLVVACAVVAAGCGSGEADAPAVATPEAREPAATATPEPSAGPGATAAPEAAAGGQASDEPAAGDAPESSAAGEGDERGISVPAEFALTGDGLTPETVTVPAFLPLELRVENRTISTQILVLDVPEPVELALPPGESGSVRVPGQRPGSYSLDAGGNRRATLVAEAETAP